MQPSMSKLFIKSSNPNANNNNHNNNLQCKHTLHKERDKSCNDEYYNDGQ